MNHIAKLTALLLGASVLQLCAAGTLDLTFTAPDSAGMFSAQNGKIAQGNGVLEYTFGADSELVSPSLEGSRNSIYNPPLEQRNTFFVVMENRSAATQVRLSFITLEDKTYDAAKSAIFDILPNSDRQGYYFNLSDNPNAKGHLAGFKLQPLGGKGRILLDRISFEEEFKIEPLAGTIRHCVAADENVIITGNIKPEYLQKYTNLVIYETAMYNAGDDPTGLRKLYEGAAKANFSIDTISLLRGTNDMTLLSSQFLAMLQNENGESIKLAPRFYIENWRKFGPNPYQFNLPKRSVNVTEFGAKGDGFTDDTAAIQKAIDFIAEEGGGRVTLPGSKTNPYGRRYVATHIKLRSNLELHFDDGAILWQSQNKDEYPYTPTYGHDTVIPNVPWTHCMHVSNFPLLYGKSIENVKITGAGKIRSNDPYCLDTQYTHYAKDCAERIHVVPIGFWDCKNIELSDVEIIRSNNYHTAFYACENIFIGNVKMHEVKCVSGDGMGLGIGTHNVKITRVFLESNDDGVVLWSSYKDPRGILWWWPKPEQDNSIRNIDVSHSYLNSGGGKAIAIIPWGTDNPNMEMQEIYNIRVYDNVLQGGYSVGPWPDNPFNGKQPFDNAEMDDFSPVKDFRIFHNEYRSPCDLICVTATDFITDCGLHSTETLQNANFKLGHCYWTIKGNAGTKDGAGWIKNGRLYEGLHLKSGRHILTAETKGTGMLFIEKAENEKDQPFLQANFMTDIWSQQQLTLEIQADGDYNLGIEGKDAQIRNINLVNTPE